MRARHTRKTSKRRRWARRSARLAVLFAAATAALVALGAIVNIGERFAYFPSRDPFKTPDRYIDVSFKTEDGLTLHGWFIPARNRDTDTPAPAVLHAHGNAGNIKNHDAFSRFIADHAMHVLVFDYRGYGRSDDAPINRHTLLTDARAAYEFLRARPDVDPERIGVYGMSLGGQPALQLAAREPDIRAVATLSTFSTWEGIAHDYLPYLGPVIMHDGLDAVDAARRLADRPYWIAHGGSDFIVDARHAPILADAARRAGADVELHTYPNGNHISMLWTHPESAESLSEFFARTLAPTGN